MIKIIFEVSEDFIEESASLDALSGKIIDADIESTLTAFADSLAYNALEKHIKKEKTEFVVKPDELDGMTKDIFDSIIGKICVLASVSETNKEKKESAD